MSKCKWFESNNTFDSCSDGLDVVVVSRLVRIGNDTKVGSLDNQFVSIKDVKDLYYEYREQCSKIARLEKLLEEVGNFATKKVK